MPDPLSDLQRLGQEFDADVVIQADRDAADAARAWCDDMNEPEMVQAFARHRIAAIEAARPMIEAWRPIESAPKDGALIDVWIGGEFPGRRTNVSWREPTDIEWWVHGGDTIETPNATWHDMFGPLGSSEPPTHWMQLPAPPAIRALGDRVG